MKMFECAMSFGRLWFAYIELKDLSESPRYQLWCVQYNCETDLCVDSDISIGYPVWKHMSCNRQYANEENSYVWIRRTTPSFQKISNLIAIYRHAILAFSSSRNSRSITQQFYQRNWPPIPGMDHDGPSDITLKGVECSEYNTHTIHVWYICLHLP